MPTKTQRQRIDYRYSYNYQADGFDYGTITPRATQFVVDDFVTQHGPVAGWRKIIADGGNATTPASGEKWTVVNVPCALAHWWQYKYTNPPIGRVQLKLDGYLLYLGVPTFNFGMADTHANNQALTRYFSNLSKVETSFKGMVAAGELAESLRMIKHPAMALRRGVGEYLRFVKRHRNMSTKRARIKAVADTWLEYSFGWLPLINDIDGAISAFYASDGVKAIFEMVKGSGRERSSQQSLASDLDVGAGYKFAYDVTSEEEVFVQYYGIYQSHGNGVPNSHTYGFRPSEFVPTLWELIPYSFLVDYFTNIGDIVSSWSYRFIGPSWTAKLVRREALQKTSNFNYRFTGDTNTYDHGTTSSNPGYLLLKKVAFTRNPSVEPGVPSFELQCPGMGSQWANLVALGVSLASARKALSR